VCQEFKGKANTGQIKQIVYYIIKDSLNNISSSCSSSSSSSRSHLCSSINQDHSMVFSFSNNLWKISKNKWRSCNSKTLKRKKSIKRKRIKRIKREKRRKKKSKRKRKRKSKRIRKRKNPLKNNCAKSKFNKIKRRGKFQRKKKKKNYLLYNKTKNWTKMFRPQKKIIRNNNNSLIKWLFWETPWNRRKRNRQQRVFMRK